MRTLIEPETEKRTARFAYWWQTEGYGDPFAVYKLGMPDGTESDVSVENLEKQGIEVPDTPDYETWKREVFSNRRCGFCYAIIKSQSAAEVCDHVESVHHRTVQ